MNILQVTIESAQGNLGNVEITRTDNGALVTCGSRILCEVRANEYRESRYAKAYEVARVICGEIRDGGRRGTGKMVPNATNSMIHDVLDEIERVAGC